jgi:hypothetical protein
MMQFMHSHLRTFAHRLARELHQVICLILLLPGRPELLHLRALLPFLLPLKNVQTILFSLRQRCHGIVESQVQTLCLFNHFKQTKNKISMQSTLTCTMPTTTMTAMVGTVLAPPLQVEKYPSRIVNRLESRPKRPRLERRKWYTPSRRQKYQHTRIFLFHISRRRQCNRRQPRGCPRNRHHPLNFLSFRNPHCHASRSCQPFKIPLFHQLGLHLNVH